MRLLSSPGERQARSESGTRHTASFSWKRVAEQTMAVYAEAMAQVLTNPGLRSDLSRRGLERARLFTWQASAEKVLSIYRRFAK